MDWLNDARFVFPAFGFFCVVAFFIWRMLTKRPLNREIRWGGWFEVKKYIYAADNEKFFVQVWNEYTNKWMHDGYMWAPRDHAEDRADKLYAEILIRTEHVSP